jgi:hypothetical protein
MSSQSMALIAGPSRAKARSNAILPCVDKHRQGCAARSYRVIAVARGLAPTTMRVTGECVTTGQRLMSDFLLVNQVEVQEDRSLRHAETSATAVASVGVFG